MVSATGEVKSAGSIRADFMERLAIERSLKVQGIFLNSAGERRGDIPCSESSVPNSQGLESSGKFEE